MARVLGPQVPWHVSRFHADYKMANTPATPVETLTMAAELGLASGLKYVYCGNLPGQADERTRCPSCKTVLIDRWGFTVKAVNLKDGVCPQCNTTIDGIWK